MLEKLKKQNKKKRAQSSIEYIMVYFWAIFAVIIIISFFSYLFISGYYKNLVLISENLNVLEKSISGKVSSNVISSSEIIDLPEKINQNSNLKITINPSSKGFYKYFYIYDKQDNLIKTASFDCDDVCYNPQTVDVFIDDSFLGDYYAAVVLFMTIIKDMKYLMEYILSAVILFFF